LVETLLKNGTKVVGVGQCDEFACPLVFSDPRAGARRAVKLLQKAGHERIGFFGGMGIRKKVEHIEDVNIHFVREMLHGIREVHPSFTLETSAISDCFSDLRNLRGKLKAGGHTAWICSDEKMCRQLLYCANELNIDIPGDISLVSFTPDLPFYSFCLDITRLYSDNSKQAAQIMNLLSNESVMQPEIFTFDYLLNKGQTVRKIKFDKKVVS
jgi:DNA-binding LacI/PurR family transcriptional regulator